MYTPTQFNAALKRLEHINKKTEGFKLISLAFQILTLGLVTQNFVERFVFRTSSAGQDRFMTRLNQVSLLCCGFSLLYKANVKEEVGILTYMLKQQSLSPEQQMYAFAVLKKAKSVHGVSVNLVDQVNANVQEMLEV